MTFPVSTAAPLATPSTTPSTTPPSTTSALSVSTSTTTSLAMKHSPLFNGRIVVYAAGSTLFSVTHYGASSEAKEFEDMFYQPGILNGPGSSDDCPIMLGGSVSASDFTLFLQVLYPGTGAAYVGPVKMDHWLAVLKLCNLWNLPGLRTRVVRELEKRFPSAFGSDVDKIVLGRQYRICKWVSEGCHAIAYRDDGLTAKEEAKLNVDTLAKVLMVREKRVTWALNGMKSFSQSTRAPTVIVKESIFCFDDVFKHAFGMHADLADSQFKFVFGKSTGAADIAK